MDGGCFVSFLLFSSHLLFSQLMSLDVFGDLPFLITSIFEQIYEHFFLLSSQTLDLCSPRKRNPINFNYSSTLLLFFPSIFIPLFCSLTRTMFHSSFEPMFFFLNLASSLFLFSNSLTFEILYCKSWRQNKRIKLFF